MKRIIALPQLWQMCRRNAGYQCTGFFDDGVVYYRQVLGPWFAVEAFTCCHTTGSAIDPVDPLTIDLIGRPKNQTARVLAGSGG